MRVLHGMAGIPAAFAPRVADSRRIPPKWPIDLLPQERRWSRLLFDVAERLLP